jgi:hypothetical protein
MGEEYMANITDNFQVEGFVEQRKELEKLMMSNPAMEKKVQGLIRSVLAEVRKKMGEEAQGAMASDPRQAYKAVRSAVYKRILGGNVNILQTRRASGGGSYTPTRTLKTGQRGGNRRLRSERTMKMESYVGADRGFVLRFLNAGTQPRNTKYGNRGAIAPRNFFGNRSYHEMEVAAGKLDAMIDELIKKEIA